MENKKSPVKDLNLYDKLYGKLKDCQKEFSNNKIIEGNVITTTCPKGYLEIKTEIVNDEWDYVKTKEFINDINRAIFNGCKEKRPSCF